jgi:tight adherence protein B
MRVRAIASLAVAATLLLSAAEPGWGAGGKLSPVGDERAFPQRKWVLSLPHGMRPAAERVRVRENGRPVRRLAVVPGDAAGAQTFGVVLVIDASASMRGEPIRRAMEAARSFAAHRARHQRLGVVTFNARANVLLPLTTNSSVIDAALAGAPPLRRGTLINDAVSRAIDLLAASGTEAGSVVVLSDGADTGSRGTAAEAAARARDHQVRVFGVGLRSRSFDPALLRGLAAATGGATTVARSPRALRGLFDALGERLANQFIVRYDSSERGGSIVNVEADVDGGAAEARARYLAPLPLPIGPARERPAASPFWRSGAAATGVTLLCALLLALAAGLLARRSPRAALRARVESFRTSPATAPPRSAPIAAPIAHMASIVERRLSRAEWWMRFAEDVDIARFRRSPAEIAVLTGAGAIASVLLGLLLGAPALVALALLLPLGVAMLVRFRAGRQRRAFEDQLPDNLQVLGSALRAGHSFTGALGAVVDGAPEPMRRELARAQSDEQLGVPIDEALLRIGRRMRTEDMDQLAVVAALQQETGGNTAEVLDRVVEALRERHALRRLVRTLTAQGRMSQLVVTALPIAIGAFIAMTNPGYLDPLFETGLGRVMTGGAVLMIAFGGLAMRRIVNIRI